MIVLSYAPGFDHIWVGTDFEEIEREMLPYMDADALRAYIAMKRDGCFNKHEEMQKTIRNVYGINEIPEAFATITRDLKVVVYSDPFFPFCALVPIGTFEECDHFHLEKVEEMKTLRVTRDRVPFPEQGVME